MDVSDADLKKEIRGFVERRLATREGTSTVTDDESLVDRGVIDSMGIFQLVAFLEEKFSIRVGDDEISHDNFRSVNAILKFVTSKR